MLIMRPSRTDWSTPTCCGLTPKTAYMLIQGDRDHMIPATQAADLAAKRPSRNT